MRNHRIVFGMLALLVASVCSAPAQATGRGKGVNFPVSCSATAQQAFNEALRGTAFVLVRPGGQGIPRDR